MFGRTDFPQGLKTGAPERARRHVEMRRQFLEPGVD